MRISDLEGDKGFEVAAKAMPLIMQIRYNPDTLKAWKATGERIRELASKKDKESRTENSNRTAIELYKYFTTMLLNEKEAAIELFAMLNGKTVEEYKDTMNAAAVIQNMSDAFIYDDDLMRLFGLRAQMSEKPSSGSASENTKGSKE